MYPIHNRIAIYKAYGITMQYQGNMNQFYKELKPFVSIWIFMNAPKKVENTIKIDHEYEETIFGKKEIFDHAYDIMKAVRIYLGKEINEENKLLALLGTLLSMDLSYEEKIERLNKIDAEFLDEEIEKEVNTMCNLGEMLQEESMNKGIEQGKELGRAEGRIVGHKEGKMNTTFKAALSIVEEFHVDFKRALIVLKITNPKEQEIYLEKYKALKNEN